MATLFSFLNRKLLRKTFLKMSNSVCCVLGYLNKNSAGSKDDPLHKFPNPAKNMQLFNTCVYSIGGDILGLDNDHIIFKHRRVCHRHFEEKYWCRNSKISRNGVPTKKLPDLSSKFSSSKGTPLKSIQNIITKGTTNKTLHAETSCLKTEFDSHNPAMDFKVRAGSSEENKKDHKQVNRILVDTGDKDVPEYQKHLSEVIQSEQVNIEHIVVTHWHHDHIGGIENLFGTIAAKPTIWKHKRSPDDAPDNELPPSVPLNWLTDGQEIKVEGATVRVHHTPGHTTDHIVLTLLEENILFSGDCILGEGTAVFEDLFTYMRSLQRILDLKPGVIYPGHGNIVEDPIQKIEYYIAHRNQREEQIYDALKTNADKQLTEMDLVKIIYTETPEHLWQAAAYNVQHHLTKLTKENRIKCVTVNEEKKWQYLPSSSL